MEQHTHPAVAANISEAINNNTVAVAPPPPLAGCTRWPCCLSGAHRFAPCQTCFLYLIWIIRRAVFPLSAQFSHFNHFILRWLSKRILQICRVHFYCLFWGLKFVFCSSQPLCSYFRNQFTQLTISFMLPTPIFSTQPCLFATNFLQPIFSPTSFFFLLSTICLRNSPINSAKTFFFSNHFHQPATINSARSFFLATVYRFANQQPPLPPNCHMNHSIKFSCLTPPPPWNCLVRLSISFFFNAKS